MCQSFFSTKTMVQHWRIYVCDNNCNSQLVFHDNETDEYVIMNIFAQIYFTSSATRDSFCATMLFTLLLLTQLSIEVRLFLTISVLFFLSIFYNIFRLIFIIFFTMNIFKTYRFYRILFVSHKIPFLQHRHLNQRTIHQFIHSQMFNGQQTLSTA